MKGMKLVLIENRGWLAPGRFLLFFLGRFFRDDCPSIAASLSYTTLLSMVPLLAIALAIFSVLPLADGLYEKVEHAVLENVIPDIGSEIQEQITGFVAKANQASGIGFAALFVTGFFLLNTIVGAFDTIWRVTDQRALWLRILMKWVFLIAWPFMVGLSITLSSYAFAMVQWVGLPADIESVFPTAQALAFAVAVLAFLALYMTLPGRRVRFLDALIGAVLAALLFDLLKRGFGLYLQYFPTYQAIYGVLAAVPIFLLWMYLTWIVVLLGAELTASLPEWRAGAHFANQELSPAEKLALAFTLLARLKRDDRGHRSLSEKALTENLPVAPGHVSEVMRRLKQEKFVRRRGFRWQIASGLEDRKFKELLDLLNVNRTLQRDWPAPVRDCVEKLLQDPTRLDDVKVADMLATVKLSN